MISMFLGNNCYVTITVKSYVSILNGRKLARNSFFSSTCCHRLTVLSGCFAESWKVEKRAPAKKIVKNLLTYLPLANTVRGLFWRLLLCLLNNINASWSYEVRAYFQVPKETLVLLLLKHIGYKGSPIQIWEGEILLLLSHKTRPFARGCTSRGKRWQLTQQSNRQVQVLIFEWI